MTFDEFAKRVRERARVAGHAFTEPDDDWMPIVIMDTPSGIAACALPVELFASYEGKEVLGKELMPGMVRGFKARKFAMVVSAWMSIVADRPDVRDAQVRGEMRPSEDPERIEIVNVTVCDPEVTRSWAAPIRRSKRRPPTLGEWKTFAELCGTPEERSAASGVTGLMVDSVVEALR